MGDIRRQLSVNGPEHARWPVPVSTSKPDQLTGRVGVHNRDAGSPKIAMCNQQKYPKGGIVEGEFV